MAEGTLNSKNELIKRMDDFEKQLKALGSRPLVHDYQLLSESIKTKFRKDEEENETDGLTKARNRKGIENLLGMEIAIADRLNHDAVKEKNSEMIYTINVAMVGIDNLKPVSEAYGNNVMDYFITLMTDSWKKARKRKTNILGRYGDDEFTLILTDSLLESAKEMVIIPFMNMFYESSKEKLAKLQKTKPLIIDGRRVDGGISLSTGMTNYPLISQGDALAVISDADEAMYQAKAMRNKAYSNPGDAGDAPGSCKGHVVIYTKAPKS